LSYVPSMSAALVSLAASNRRSSPAKVKIAPHDLIIGRHLSPITQIN